MLNKMWNYAKVAINLTFAPSSLQAQTKAGQ